MATLERNAPTVDVQVTKGDTFAMSIVIRDKDTGATIDVTGRTYALEIRKVSDQSLIATASVDTSGAASGAIGFTVSSGDTSGMSSVIQYAYDVEETNGSNIRTIFGGEFRIFTDVTA